MYINTYLDAHMNICLHLYICAYISVFFISKSDLENQNSNFKHKFKYIDN